MDIQPYTPSREPGQQILAGALLMCTLIAFILINTYSPPLASAAFNTSGPPSQMPLEQMMSQYRVLRTTPGHFDGESWNKEVDLWSGKKHLLMRALSHWLDKESADKRQVMEVMGKPDSIVTADADEFDELPQEMRKGEVLIYFWRNRHDYLYFTCKEAMPCRSDWWYAFD